MQRERAKHIKEPAQKITEFENPNVRAGSTKSTFFKAPSYLPSSQYQDPDAVVRAYEKQNILKRIKASPFKTIGTYRQLSASSYPYTELKEGARDPKRFRNEDGGVVIPKSNIKAGPVDKFFTKIEYKEDDYSRKQIFSRQEYKRLKQKEYAIGLFHNKITIENPTFSANKEIFGASEPSPVEVLKQKYLKEQAILNRTKTQNRVARIARRKLKSAQKDQSEDLSQEDETEGEIKKKGPYVYAPPPYIKCGFDTRIFERMHKAKEEQQKKKEAKINKTNAPKKQN